MKININTTKSVKYKGHVIRVFEDEFGCTDVLIDNDADEIETSPIDMNVNEFKYGTIADAKRCINNQMPIWVNSGIWDCRREEFINRFK